MIFSDYLANEVLVSIGKIIALFAKFYKINIKNPTITLSTFLNCRKSWKYS